MNTEMAKKPLTRGAPGWMVTFADLMALLVALFVLILSFADFDIDRFMNNTGPIAEAFNSTRSDIPITQLQLGTERIQTSDTPRDDLGNHDLRWIQNTLDKFERSLSSEIAAGYVVVEDIVDGVVVRMGDVTAFAPGSSRLSAGAKEILDSVADIITKIEGRIVVSGHANDESLDGSQFTSIWELSASRAASVVQYLSAVGKVKRRRIIAQGFADSRPLNDALTPAARAENRRVEILVTRSREVR